MNALLQLAAFDVAFEAFDLPNRLEFALRQITREEPLSTSSEWQMRLSGLADRLNQFASRLNLSVFTEEANAAAHSLRECRIAVVESFGLNEPSESGLTELQTINETQIGTAADWDASDHLQYQAFLKDKVTEILRPFLARLGGLRNGLPIELRPFFEFCQRTWSIPRDLNEWCEQTSANSRQRHAQLLNVIRPDLQSLLQRCVSYQPGLSAVAVSYLDFDSDRLEIELRSLRLAARQILVDLSSLAARVDPVCDETEAEPEETEDEPDETEDVPDPEPVVPVGQRQVVPYTTNDVGVVIYGVQVLIASDAMTVLMHLCESVNARSYIELAEIVNAARKDPNNKQSNNDLEIKTLGMRQLMTKVRKALRTAFRTTEGEPIKTLTGTQQDRFVLDREWLATYAQKLKNDQPPVD